jgi:minor extracellular serine protease Vpr
MNMKKNVLLLCILLLSFGTVSAQTSDFQDNPKCNAFVNVFLKQYHNRGLSAASKAFAQRGVEQGQTSVVLYCNDEATTMNTLVSMGLSPRAITPTIVTVTLPVDQIETVANLQSVRKLSGMRQHYLQLDVARSVTKVDAVQAGTDLDTPYTGKGVVVGIIDQGIRFDHPAFRVTTDSTRIVAAWNLSSSMPGDPSYNSAAVLRLADDGLDETHGTHVAGIAASGSAMGSDTYYGMAPEASIVAVSSSDFSDADILNGIQLVKNVAAQRNAPWVVNMSIGTLLDAHDGYDDTSLLLDSIAQGGGIFVASAGNEGGNDNHAQYTFTADGDTAYFVVDANGASQYMLSFAGSDDTKFTVTPYIYNPTTMAITAIPFRLRAQYFESAGETNEVSGRYSMLAYAMPNSLLGTSTGHIVFEIVGKAGRTIHAWTDGNTGAVFYNNAADTRLAAADSKYTVCSPSLSRSAISVGSFVTRIRWKALDGNTYSYTNSPFVGSLSTFSSVGPTTDSTLLKPEVCAPGQGIISSIKKVGDYAGSDGSAYLVSKQSLGGQDYYYAIMQGTSMASPAAAGIIALWLQANPDLTRQQVLDIIKETSTPFYGQSQSIWDPSYGYGKIDAYAGLKKALSLPTAIATVKNSSTPLTIKKGASQWNILFNSDESFARLSLTSLDGRQCYAKTLTNVHRGQEEIVPFSGLTRGVYILNVKTRNSNASRKVMVD